MDIKEIQNYEANVICPQTALHHFEWRNNIDFQGKTDGEGKASRQGQARTSSSVGEDHAAAEAHCKTKEVRGTCKVLAQEIANAAGELNLCLAAVDLSGGAGYAIMMEWQYHLDGMTIPYLWVCNTIEAI